MVWVIRNWLMEMSILDSLIMAAFTDKDYINGKMEVLMKGSSSEEKGKEREHGKVPTEMLLKDSTTTT